MTKAPTARTIMSAPVHRINEEATVEKAAARMLSEHVSALVVTPTAEDEPYGIVTTTDIVAGLARGVRLRSATVADIMTSPLLIVTPHVPAQYVARLMDRADVRHVAVFNGRDVVGIISSRDLLKALMHENAGESGGQRPRADVPA